MEPNFSGLALNIIAAGIVIACGLICIAIRPKNKRKNYNSMEVKNDTAPQPERVLMVRISYAWRSEKYFLDLWDTERGEYLVSVQLGENEALGISRESNIEIVRR